jgi:hypothetical protein
MGGGAGSVVGGIPIFIWKTPFFELFSSFFKKQHHSYIIHQELTK